MISEETDEVLLLAVARSRNREAFDHLVRRHLARAHQLATHLCASPIAAEDVVQEVLLRVWNKAHTFTGGAGRSWILRIVVNEALRGRKRLTPRASPESESKAAEAARCREVPLESQETLDLLRLQLQRLTVPERHLITLRFGAGLSLGDIARTLGMPKSTVKIRVERILGALRSSLTAAGLADASILPDCGLLAFFEHAALPSAELLARCQALSLKPLASASSKAVAWSLAGVAAVLVLAVVGTEWKVVPTTPYVTAGQAEPSVGPRNRAVPALPAKRFHQRWTFEKGPAPDLTLAGGEWSWFPPQEDFPGVMAVKPFAATEAGILLPKGPAGRPLAIRSSIRSFRTGPGYFLPLWTEGQTSLAFQTARQEPKPTNQWVDHRAIVYGRHVLTEVDGRLLSVGLFDRDPAGARLTLGAINVLVREIEIEVLAEEDLPSPLPNCDFWKTVHFDAILKARLWDKHEKNGSGILPAVHPPDLLSHQFDFRSGLPVALPPLPKTARWLAPQGGIPGRLELPVRKVDRLVLGLPGEVSIYPMILKAELWPSMKGTWNLVAEFADAQGLSYPHLSRWEGMSWHAQRPARDSSDFPASVAPRRPVTVEIFLDRSYVLQTVNGRLCRVDRYQVPLARPAIVLLAGFGCEVFSLDFRELSRVPYQALAPDPQSYFSGFARDPAALTAREARWQPSTAAGFIGRASK